MLDNKRIQLGDGDDFQIYHNGSNNYLKGTQNQLIYIGTNNVDRWYFANDGHFRPEANNSYDIGSSSIVVETSTPTTFTYLTKVHLTMSMVAGVTGQYRKENQTCS